MSNSRQTTLRSLSVKYPPNHLVDWHVHDWSQLIYANEGAMTVSLEGVRWVVPPRRAIHLRKGNRHRIEMHGRVFLRTIYLSHDLGGKFNEVVLDVDSLMHELIQHVCDRGMVRSDTQKDRTLIRFFEQHLTQQPPSDSDLKMPQDDRAKRFAEHILLDPATKASLKSIANECGTSLRTVQRLFPIEVGLTVSQWRQRVQMMRAIEHLGRGESVTQIAFSLGFESVSAFIHSFKNCFGITPGKYQTK